MRFAHIFAVVASVASIAYAHEEDDEATTTLTSTTTKTITVTQCNPTVTNCPAKETTALYPLSNSTSVYAPTGTGPVTVVVIPTKTSVTVVTSTPSTVATAAGSNLFVQGSLLLGAVGVALAAAF